MNRPPIIPSNVAPEVRRYLTDLNKYVMEELASRTADGTARFSIPLVSNSGVVYNLAVSDAGTLTVTKVLG